MCGIFFSSSRTAYIAPDPSTESLLRNRGPDSLGIHQVFIPRDATCGEHDDASGGLYLTFVSTVLALRGASVVEQPLRDDATGSVLCWNGEAWTIGSNNIVGNDSQHVFASLLASSSSDVVSGRESSIHRTASAVSAIRGPHAFVYYDARNSYLYYARDCLGRRSLLRASTSTDSLTLSSVCNSSGMKWAEVEADGLYVVDLATASADLPLHIVHIPRRLPSEPRHPDTCLTSPFPGINRNLPSEPSFPASGHVDELHRNLRRSLQLRVQHVREAIDSIDYSPAQSARVAILFSGGLDCTVLARICHDLLPVSETIDLLNVAFQNPRVHGKLDPTVSPYALCPDRITGHASHAELVRICPGRSWRFVEIDVAYKETVAHRSRVMTLMHPHNTEMDLSISYALYFASRGEGVLQLAPRSTTIQYSTSAHVLLSGLGADELFGGYQRHATAYDRHGYTGLLDELELDFGRIGKRNLGRDDRVISDSGKEVRFPFLDEGFIVLVLGLPVWAKCDFGNPQQLDSVDAARLLEPGKRILRLLAWQLGMKSVATEKKRAIQFGARTAKMETGKTKGTQTLV
ncbi:hypothetical protein K491DRAFT_765164 [Lophiostoma macrostomum CBS 122681]|uniref:Asparagine synthetase domain-containing protein n=1 Tax=Lophiostoma macrostomum CBS 122681 TaxID=1314788 RepID=A0A6A6TPR1_9PLEO|nr:hypothetical protein K491DRAFT_765164 [Lophiostoma macrostomum CBS 122681]